MAEENKIIKTIDENGKEHNFELLDIINVDDQDYGLLVYVDQEAKNDDSEEEEVVIMRLYQENDEYTFEAIEEDEEFDKVVDAISYDEEFEDEE
ncbi:MAG: DUF1292 domain-containing protein [Candidatus Gastranaerophilales bacterium]|nr:DUF1292 domain-containing protein [Candidatus Gastranaerophilales bacterium]